MKNKVIFVVGPTAVGKTSFAFATAKEFNGELVSADSVQVFKGLDIISGKDLPQGYKFKYGYYYSQCNPSIYLLDVVEPTNLFNVFEFYNLAIDAIQDILSKGKLPIVVGGTGLYVEALLNGLNKTVEPDSKIRAQLDKLGLSDLQNMIPQKDLVKLNNSDINNKRRLVRLIEKIKINKKVKNPKPNYESLVIGLLCDKVILQDRIVNRILKRVKDGALEEVKNLFQNYDNLTQQVKDANGYKQLFQFLKKEISLDEAIEKWKISEYRHAKNQMTWFQKYGNVEWFDIYKLNHKKNIGKRINDFLTR